MTTFNQHGRRVKVHVPTKEEETNDREKTLKKYFMEDEKNPAFLFSCTHTELLCKIVNGEIDALELAKKELQNRGLDRNGRWVGFHKEI